MRRGGPWDRDAEMNPDTKDHAAMPFTDRDEFGRRQWVRLRFPPCGGEPVEISVSSIQSCSPPMRRKPGCPIRHRFGQRKIDLR